MTWKTIFHFDAVRLIPRLVARAGGLLALSVVGAAHAEMSEADYFADVPIVLSASRLSQSLADAPAAVTVIDRDMIRASGFTELADLFRLVPGMNVAYFSGPVPTVTYHGLGDGFSRRMQVLVDGRSIYSAHFGQVFWRNLALTLDDIDRIEVVRGPAAASYGANAFMGVINIQTRHSAETRGGRVELLSGGRDMHSAQVRLGAQSGDLSYRLTLGQRGDDHFKNYPDDVQERFVEGRADYRLNHRDELTTQFGVSRTATESSFAVPNHPTEAEDRYIQIRWRRVLQENHEWSLTYNYTQQGVDDRLSLPFFVEPINFDFSTRRHNLGLQYITPWGKHARASLGAEIRQDSVVSQFYFNRRNALIDTSARVFGNVEWRPLSHWLINVGAMLERNHLGDTELSPRFTLHYQPVAEHAFRIGITRGYRTPSYYEAQANSRVSFGGFTNIIDTPAQNLRSETVLSRELGYVFQLPKLSLRGDVRAFLDDYRKLIQDVSVSAPADTLDGVAFQRRNRATARLRGLEFQLQWQPWSGSRLILNQAWVSVDSSDVEIAHSAPSYTLNLLASQQLGHGLDASFGYYRTAAMTWLEDGTAVPAFDRLDLRLGRRFKLGGHAAELAVVAQGLLGDYAEFSPLFQFDRRVFGSFTLQW